MWLITQLLSDHHYIKLIKQEEEEEKFNIYVQIKHIILNLKRKAVIKRGHVLYIPQKRKRGIREEQKEIKIITHHCSNRKKHSAKRWVVQRTNSWHNRFRKLFTKYEKEVENYLGLVQLSCCMIIYRKIVFGIGS